jgi:hypothetical protein
MQRKTLYATDGETIAVNNQWAAETQKRGTTVSSSAWEYTGSGSLAGAALSGTSATVRLTPESCGTLVNTATLANGEVLIVSRAIVMDGQPPRDYQ